MEGDRTFANPLRWGLFAIWVVLALLCAGYIGQPKPASNPIPSRLFQTALVLGVVASLLLAWRTSRSRIVLHPSKGLILYRVFASRSVTAWEDIDAFEVTQPQPSSMFFVVGVRKEGKVRRLTATMSSKQEGLVTTATETANNMLANSRLA